MSTLNMFSSRNKKTTVYRYFFGWKKHLIKSYELEWFTVPLWKRKITLQCINTDVTLHEPHVPATMPIFLEKTRGNSAAFGWKRPYPERWTNRIMPVITILISSVASLELYCWLYKSASVNCVPPCLPKKERPNWHMTFILSCINVDAVSYGHVYMPH